MRTDKTSLLIIVVYTMLAAPLRAQSPSETNDAIAHAHFQAGTGYFDTGDYASAIREYERAYALTHYPQLLYNLYASHERLGQLSQAADRLAQFIEASPDAPNRAALEERVANLRRRIASPATAPTPDAEDAPEPQPEPSHDTVAPPEQRPSPAPRLRPGPFIGFGIGGAGLVTFGVAGLMARSEDRALAKSCGSGASRTCTDAQVAGLRHRTIVADVGIGLAVGGAALGLILLLTQDDDDDVTISGGVDAHSGSVVVLSRF